MKHVFVIFFVGFLAVKALGQQSVDIGFAGAAGTYFGDMTKIDLNGSVNPEYGGFVRFNFNPRYALRFNVMNGTIGATGEYDYHPWNFSKNVFDVSLNFEFNFLPYIVGDKSTHWSTYIFGGVGVQMYKYNRNDTLLAPLVNPTYFAHADPGGSIVSPTIPFGLGIKVNLSRRWGLGIEGSMRKTFMDKLDDLDDPLSYVNADGVLIKYTDQFHNNDWTAYLGIHLVYKLIYGNKEWELRTPRKKMIDWGIESGNRKEKP